MISRLNFKYIDSIFTHCFSLSDFHDPGAPQQQQRWASTSKIRGICIRRSSVTGLMWTEAVRRLDIAVVDTVVVSIIRIFGRHWCNHAASGGRQCLTILVRTKVQISAKTVRPTFTKFFFFFLPSGPKVPLSHPAPDRECSIFGLTRQKNLVYAPWEQIKNALDRMFVTLVFGSGDNLHAIWDILYFYSLGV